MLNINLIKQTTNSAILKSRKNDISIANTRIKRRAKEGYNFVWVNLSFNKNDYKESIMTYFKELGFNVSYPMLPTGNLDKNGSTIEISW